MEYPEEIIQLAATSKDLPKWSTPPEIFLFLSLRNIYSAYYQKFLIKELAELEKEKVLRSFSEYTDLYNKYKSVIKEQGFTIRDSEKYRSQLHYGADNDFSYKELLKIACECIYELTHDRTILNLLDWDKAS